MDTVQQPTPRQLEMLSLCARGFSREEIGRELYLSPWTVKVTLDEARGRLGARNVTHAVSLCIVRGYLLVDGGRVCAAGPALIAA